MIGDAWVSTAGKRGVRRLDDPGDFVRIEIEAALSRRIPVIPVLVGESSVPSAEELPESLRPLSFRHGLSIRPDPDFHQDVDRLIRGIEAGVSALRERSAPQPGVSRGPGPVGLMSWSGGGATGIIDSIAVSAQKNPNRRGVRIVTRRA